MLILRFFVTRVKLHTFELKKIMEAAQDPEVVAIHPDELVVLQLILQPTAQDLVLVQDLAPKHAH